MKKKLLGLIAIIAAAAMALAAEDSVKNTTVAITVNVSGTLSPADRRAARFIVTAENVARIGAGTNALPASSPADLKAAYEATLTRILNDAHKSYIETANREASKNALTSEQLDKLNTAVADLVASGVSADAIIAAVKAAK